MIQNIAVRTPEKRHTTITTHRRKLKIMPAVLALQERFNFTSHAESPPLFYIHFFILRADRIIVGEVRGKEALDLLQSLNTGHDGGFSSGHANSVKDMLARLETMVLMAADLPLPAIRSQIASAVDVMVHVARMRDKTRKITAIEEVDRFENGEIILNPLFAFRETKCPESRIGDRRKVEGSLERVGALKHREKLRLAGYDV